MADGAVLYSILHVPKCAGTTLERHFQAHLDPARFLRLPMRRSRREFLADREARRRARGTVEVFTGHNITRDLEREIADGREIRRIVLLREPLGLFLSHYNYRMMRYLHAGKGVYPLAVALKSRVPNYVAHFLLREYLEIGPVALLRMSDRERFERLNGIFGDFWFIGDYQRCGEVMERLAGELGISPDLAPQNTATQWKAKTGWEPAKREDLDASQLEAWKRCNAVDELHYRMWHGAGWEVPGVTPIEWPGPERRVDWKRELERAAYQVRRRMMRG